MYWIVVSSDDYGEHVNVDSSEEYARAVFKRLSDDATCYSVELFRAECVNAAYK